MSEPVLLDTVLRPTPPLKPEVLMLIVALVAAVNLAFATTFVLQGAWPIAPFMGLDVGLLAWAFRTRSRATLHEERVYLTPSLLRIDRRPPKGPAREIVLNPYWVRVDMDDPPEHHSQLTLWSHGQGFRVGTFLPPEERASFAGTLRNALRAARTAMF